MAKKKVSRKELLKSPDEFITISSRAAEYAKAHQQQLIFGGIALAVIAVGYLIFNVWMGSINEAGQNAYNQAVKNLETVSAEPQIDPEDLIKADALFSEVTENYGMSNAGRLALAQVAHVKTLEKKYPEAITFYKEFLNKVSGDAQYESLTSLALAACYEAEGNFKTAIDTLAPLEASSSDTPFRESAMWGLARLYRLDNQPEKAEETLKTFVEQYEGSPFHAMAKAKR